MPDHTGKILSVGSNPLLSSTKQKKCWIRINCILKVCCHLS